MALLQRLFNNRRNAKQYNHYRREESPNGSQHRLRLDKSRIRLIVIADTEKGRVPYFDSNAIKKLDDPQLEQKKGLKSACRLVPGSKNAKDGRNGAGVSAKPEAKFQFQKMGSDVKLLEEMMFGAVAMAYKGSTLKVHHIRCPPQLVVTKVFYPEKAKPDSVSVDTDSDSTPSSLSSSYADPLGDSTPIRRVKNSHVTSIPMDVPFVRESFGDSCDEDSGLYSLTSSGSFQSLFPSPSNSSANSYNSLHRRWMRSQTTSLTRRWDSQETLNSMENSQMRKKKQIKIAIGILFSTSDGKSFQEEKDTEEYRIFQSFFFSHMALIEGHVEELRSSVEAAYFTGRMVPSIFESLDEFRNSMQDLYMAPRLREPVWLSMMSNVSYRYALCERFIHEFMFLAAKYDNKTTKFFISTLLSAVLTYHLAWVATVTPGDGAPSKTYLDKHSAKWIDTLAKTHPYNPLWAQLGDLYGAIGHPLRVARTVVVGRKADLVNKVLYMLSYFIRCSDVHEAPFSTCLQSVLDSRCWEDQAGPVQSVCSMDGSTSTLVEPPDSPTPLAAEAADTAATCSSCGSCTSALHFYSAQGRKGESPSPKRASNRGRVDPDRTCVKAPLSPCDSEAGSGMCRHELETCQHKLECRQKAEQTAADVCEGVAACEGRVLSDDSGIENSGSYDRSGKVKKGSRVCKMSEVLIVEDGRLENVQHVQRSADCVSPVFSEEHDHGVDTPSKWSEERACAVDSDGKTDPHSKRPVSMLAWQLAADSEGGPSTQDRQKSMIREAQKQFLSGASNSMFEEYFDGDVETKTIDDVCEHQRVVKHPLAGDDGVRNPSPVSPHRHTGSGEDRAASPQPKAAGVSRQGSVDSKPRVSRPTALNPARCRSVTPIELNRRRHLSSSGSVDMDVFDPLIHCQEISMPQMTTQPDQFNLPSYDKNFGRSLLGGYSDHYMSDFVLHGTSDTSFRPKLLHDLQSTLQHSILGEPVAESVCIIADTDNWTVEVANSRLLEMSSSGTMPWTTSHLVASLIESVLDLHRLKMSSEFCIMHLEDRMQEMYFKSLMLAEYIKGVKCHNQQQLTAMLGFDASDLPLLLSIAGTHTPNLALGSEGKMRSSYQ